MPFPNPTCPRCSGSGDTETIQRDGSGTIIAFIYDRCPCTFRSAWVDEEDWAAQSVDHPCSNLSGDL